MRVVENGRAVHVRRVRPPADGTPLTERFRVSPSLDAPSVYDVEIAAAPGRADAGQQPPARCWSGRRAGPARCCSSRARPATSTASSSGPGSWIAASRSTRSSARAATTRGVETYYVQAPRGRAAALAGGFPATREALFRYDAIVLANVGADLLGPTELELVRDFVAERGGGLLMLGARTLAPAGLAGDAARGADAGGGDRSRRPLGAVVGDGARGRRRRPHAATGCTIR